MTERDVPFLQGGNYTAAEVRRIVSALTGAPDFVDLAPSTSPLVSAGGGHGVVGSSDMAVTAGAGTTVNVSAGLALVRGTQQSDQGVYVTSNDAAKNLTISAADATNPRKDLIVTRVKDAEYGIAGDTGPLEVVSGTPTGGLTAGNATGRPTPPENALVLAEVFVPAGAASSASYTITDLRTRAYALGGVVVCTSTTRPTATVFEGQVIYETDTDKLLVYSGAAWVEFATIAAGTSYTPAFTSTGTAPTMNAGNRTGRYFVNGKRVTGWARCTFTALGAGEGAGTGNYRISLPLTASSPIANGDLLGAATVEDAGTRRYVGTATIATTTTARVVVDGGAELSATGPVAPANGDVYMIRFDYETS